MIDPVHCSSVPSVCVRCDVYNIPVCVCLCLSQQILYKDSEHVDNTAAAATDADDTAANPAADDGGELM